MTHALHQPTAQRERLAQVAAMQNPDPGGSATERIRLHGSHVQLTFLQPAPADLKRRGCGAHGLVPPTDSSHRVLPGPLEQKERHAHVLLEKGLPLPCMRTTSASRASKKGSCTSSASGPRNTCRKDCSPRCPCRAETTQCILPRSNPDSSRPCMFEIYSLCKFAFI